MLSLERAELAMPKKKTKYQLAREKAELSIKKTNETIDELGCHASDLYDGLNGIQELFDMIRNIPSEKRVQYTKLEKIRLNWKHQAEKIEQDYKAAAVKNAGGGAAGVGAGVAVAALGPSAAMGIATTFGVASTGTAISALSGAAATNAALAWLGGGALAVGGGGMAAGEAFLTLAGPVGWAIAGVALIGSGLMVWKTKSDQKKLEGVFTLISERDAKTYDLATVELNERIIRIKHESELLAEAIERIKGFGTDYDAMTEAQQYELGSFVNLMESSTQLLVNPILGLQPKYTEADFEEYVSTEDRTIVPYFEHYKELIISFANLFYKIELDDTEEKLLVHSFKKNKEFMKVMKIDKKEMNRTVFHAVRFCLSYKFAHVEM